MTHAPQTSDASATNPRLLWGSLLGGLALLVTGLVARHYWSPEVAPPPAPPASATAAAAPATAPAKPVDPATLKVVAVVNAEEISREDLARECLRRHGKEVLEATVNKRLIVQECQRRQIAVTEAEIRQEIQRLASSYKLPVEQWLKVTCRDRHCTPEQYGEDVIWPTLAVRKLANHGLEVTAEEIQREYEAQYGPSIKARMICCDTRRDADSVWAEAVAHPESFGNLAQEHSRDSSASLKGRVQPIRKHMGTSPLESKIEQVAFSLQDGEISPVIPLANQFVILQREEELAGSTAPLTETLRASLEETIRERKLQPLVHEAFGRLQKESRVENVFNDPVKGAELPGVAAVVNGQAIALEELAEACIAQHGVEVLDRMIQRRLLEQACRKANVTVAEADLEAEIAKAAAASLPSNAEGAVDVEGWLKLASEQQGVSPEVYRRDIVWTLVALKKLVGDAQEISDEDIQKSYDRNYGPRVRCRAIVLDNLHRATQVWELARKAIADKPAEKAEAFFGDLAEQYSMESGSRALKGEVPPLQRNGSQPLLEKEAFELKAGELSSIIPAGNDYFVILYCLGQTRPVEVELATVRSEIEADVREKKLQTALETRSRQILEEATVENFLTGTSHAPQPNAG